jgi:hypothetical protein
MYWDSRGKGDGRIVSRMMEGLNRRCGSRTLKSPNTWGLSQGCVKQRGRFIYLWNIDSSLGNHPWSSWVGWESSNRG